MTVALALLALFITVRALRIRGRLSHHERLKLVQCGWISCELWRKASLVAHHDASGVKTFPLPQETRTRVWRCGGIPFRVEVQSLGLPLQVSDQIDAVGASQFDALFSGPYRLSAGSASAMIRAHAAQRSGLSRL